MKKIYNFLFIFCLSVGFLLGFNGTASKAAIIPPNASLNVPYTRQDFESKITDYKVFNSFDYTFLDKILVDIHLTSSNLIETNIIPTQQTVTTYSGNCFGNLCYQQQVKLLLVYMYYYTSGGSTKIYYFSNNETSSKTLNYSTTSCNTVTYVNNTVSTSNRNLYLLFTDTTKYNNAVNNLYTAYENNTDLMLGTGSSLATAITNMESNYGAKLLYNTNTGITNSSTSKTSTCKSSQSNSYTCSGNLNETYYINLYNNNLGSINLNQPLSYFSNKCYITSIGSNIDNGYYKSYEFNFSSLTNNEKKNIWYKLTQYDLDNNYGNLETLGINKSTTNSTHVVNGLNVNFRMELKFKGNINYIYNNMYIKFNTNSSATLRNFYYGIFDINFTYSTNNTYTTAVLKENSRINTDNLIIISDIDITSGENTFDYNFNIALLSEVMMEQILSIYDYKDCEWYQFLCHLENFFSKTIYDIPILSDFYQIFNNITNTVLNYFNLLKDYKDVAFIGTVAVLSLVYHLVKKITE